MGGEGEEISSSVRSNIFDGLKIEGVIWFGELDDEAFLNRIFDLEALPSYDERYQNAAGDIWQHRFNNNDWPVDWIYGDTRFNLLNCTSTVFLNFLCEIVHPVVRPDKKESLKLVGQFNDQLRQDGWNLIEVEQIAGRPRYSARRIKLGAVRAVSRAKVVADVLDSSSMSKAIQRLENSVEDDPDLAIGTAKELVESLCKTILDRKGIDYSKNATLSKLTKSVATTLKLVPEGISDETKGAELIKRILGSLSVLTQHLSELRGLYGTGHGRTEKHIGLQPRHARLAVGTAVTFIEFVLETYHNQAEDE